MSATVATARPRALFVRWHTQVTVPAAYSLTDLQCCSSKQLLVCLLQAHSTSNFFLYHPPPHTHKGIRQRHVPPPGQHQQPSTQQRGPPVPPPGGTGRPPPGGTGRLPQPGMQGPLHHLPSGPRPPPPPPGPPAPRYIPPRDRGVMEKAGGGTHLAASSSSVLCMDWLHHPLRPPSGLRSVVTSLVC